MRESLILKYLDAIYHGDEPSFELLWQDAVTNAEFCRQWLCHAISSDASPTELALVLTIADYHQLDDLILLVKIWRDLIPDNTMPTFEAKTEFHKTIAGFTEKLPNDTEVYILWTKLAFISKLSEKIAPTPVQHYKIALTKYVCEQIVSRAGTLMRNAEVYTPTQVTNIETIRNNSQCPVLSPCSDPIFASIERFIARRLGLLLSHAEPLIIYRYIAGQEYKWHCDYIPEHHQYAARELALFGQRQFTAICYLTEDFEGGETAFKVWQLVEKGTRGSLLKFCNLLSDGRPDPNSVHCGKPVISGEKWICTLWFRQQPMWTRAALLSIDDRE